MGVAKKVLALVLVILMILGMVPTESYTVFGYTEQGNSASMIDNKVNFYLESYGGNNLEWTVINNGNTNNELTVLLSDVLKEKEAGNEDTVWCLFSKNSSTQYNGSDIQGWLQMYLDCIFMLPQEQNALIQITTDATGQSEVSQNGKGGPPYTYLLSKDDYDSILAGDIRLVNSLWWLSTSSVDDNNSVEVVKTTGATTYQQVTSLAAIRPALKLDKTKITDLTFVTDFQSQLKTPTTLTNHSDLTADKKLALIDSTNSTTLTIDKVYTFGGLTGNSSVVINYSNATTSSCNGMRVRLKSNATGNIYYGVISQLSQASGQATFELPEDISAGYEMSIWNEQFNPGYATNITSPVTTYTSANNPIQIISPTSDWYNFEVTPGTDYSITITPSDTAIEYGYNTIGVEGAPTSTFSNTYVLTSSSSNLADIENTTVNLQFLNDSGNLLNKSIQINLGSIINNLELDVEGTTDTHFMQKFYIEDNSIGLRDWKIVNNNSNVVDSEAYESRSDIVNNDLIQWPMTMVDGLSCITDVLYKFIVTNNAGISSFAQFKLKAPDFNFFNVTFDSNKVGIISMTEKGNITIRCNADSTIFKPTNSLYQIALDNGSRIFNWDSTVAFSTKDISGQTIHLRLKNENGNISCPSCPITVVYDNTPPTVTGVTNGDKTNVGYNIGWNISCNCCLYEVNEDGVPYKKIYYDNTSFDNGVQAISYNNIYVNKPGDYQLIVEDLLGNSKTINFTVCTVDYSITPSLPGNGWYNSDVIIKSNSGGYSVYVDFSNGNNKPPTKYNVPWEDQVVVQAEGINGGLLYFKDSAGNVSAPVVLNPINIDKTPPNDMDIKLSQDDGQTYTSIYNQIGRFIDGPGWFFKDRVKVEIQANDPKPAIIGGRVGNAIASGISRIESYITNTFSTPDTTIIAETAFTVLKNFVGTIKSIATDGAGNSTSITSGTFVVADGNFNPEITLTNGVNTCFSQGINLNAGISGLNQYSLYNAENDTTTTYTYSKYTVNDYLTVDQPGQYELTVTNNIDNKTVVKFNVTVPDSTWYTITPEKDTYDCYNSAVTITSTKTSSDSTPYAIKRDGGEWVNPSIDPLTGNIIPPSITINPEDTVPVYLYFMDTKNSDNITLLATEPIMLKFALPVTMAELNVKSNADAVAGIKSVVLNDVPPTSFNTFYFAGMEYGGITNPGDTVSGINKCTYRFVDEHGNAGEICEDGRIKFPNTKGDFAGYIEVNITYNAGHAITMYSQGFTIDVMPPQITGVVNGQSYSSGSTVSWSDSGSGVARVNVDGVDLDIGIVSKGSTYVSTVGQHQIYAVDNVGNVSQVINFTIIDPSSSNKQLLTTPPQSLQSHLPKLSHPQNSQFLPIVIAILGVLVGGGIVGVVVFRKKSSKKGNKKEV